MLCSKVCSLLAAMTIKDPKDIIANADTCVPLDLSLC